MAGTGEKDEAARLEAALERIARHRTEAPGAAIAAETKAALAHRLDTLIAELRAILGRDSSD